MEVRALLEHAIRIAGSQAALGKAIGMSQNAIYQAKERGTCTEEMALRIHHALGGRVSASKLRPDRWPTPQYVPPDPRGKIEARRRRAAA